MDLYVILRRDGWRSGRRAPDAPRPHARTAGGRADAGRHPLDPQLCVHRGGAGPRHRPAIYERVQPEAIHAHADAAGLPVTEIVKVADTVIVGPTRPLCLPETAHLESRPWGSRRRVARSSPLKNRRPGVTIRQGQIAAAAHELPERGELLAELESARAEGGWLVSSVRSRGREVLARACICRRQACLAGSCENLTAATSNT